MTPKKQNPGALAGAGRDEITNQNTRTNHTLTQQIEQILFGLRLTAGIVAAVTIGLLIVGGAR